MEGVGEVQVGIGECGVWSQQGMAVGTEQKTEFRRLEGALCYVAKYLEVVERSLSACLC